MYVEVDAIWTSRIIARINVMCSVPNGLRTVRQYIGSYR